MGKKEELAPFPTERFLFALVMLVGLLLRLHEFGQWPPPLFTDEAVNGLDALRVLGGWHPIYFPANFGREGMYIYAAGAVIGLLGPSPAALRLPALLAGLLTIPATYALGNAWFGRRVGLLASAVVAVSFWPIHLSRIAFRAVLLPPVLALALASGTLALRRRSRIYALGAGLLYGLSFHTYLAARFTPLPLAVSVGYLAASRPGWWRRNRALLGVAALGAAVAIAPLAWAFAVEPDVVMGRAGLAAIWNPDVNGGDMIGALARQVPAVLGMFFWRGDSIPRHNAPYRPVFDPLMAIFWCLGLAWMARRAYRGHGGSVAALLWMGFMLGPTLLAEDAPHFLRAVGVLPVAVFPAAIGLESAGGWISRRRRVPRALGPLAIAFVVAASAAVTAIDYASYATSQETDFAFEGAVGMLASEVNGFLRAGWHRGMWNAVDSEPLPDRVAVVDWRIWDRYPALGFLCGEDGILVFRDEAPPEPDAENILLALWPYEPLERMLNLIRHPARIRPEIGPLACYDRCPEPYHLYYLYEVEPAATYDEALASFEDGIELESVGVSYPERGVLSVTLVWGAGSDIDRNYTAFVHVLSPDRVSMIGQMDAPAGTLAYPTGLWRRGDLVIEEREILLSGNAQPNGAVLRLGLYDPVDGNRLAVPESRLPSEGDMVYYDVPPQNPDD